MSLSSEFAGVIYVARKCRSLKNELCSFVAQSRRIRRVAPIYPSYGVSHAI